MRHATAVGQVQQACFAARSQVQNVAVRLPGTLAASEAGLSFSWPHTKLGKACRGHASMQWHRARTAADLDLCIATLHVKQCQTTCQQQPTMLSLPAMRSSARPVHSHAQQAAAAAQNRLPSRLLRAPHWCLLLATGMQHPVSSAAAHLVFISSNGRSYSIGTTLPPAISTNLTYELAMSAAPHGATYQPLPACTPPARKQRAIKHSSRLTAKAFRGRVARLQAQAKGVRSPIQASKKRRQP